MSTADESVWPVGGRILPGDPARSDLGIDEIPGVQAAVIRGLDVTIAFITLVFFLPVMGLVALAVLAQDGGNPVFAHYRIGHRGRSFPCLKFRSMVVDADERLKRLLEMDPAARSEWKLTHKLRNDPRITKLGRFLRKSSLDELPQLINVLRGEMSLVGPRPIVHSEIVHYGRWFSSYCSVRPGITGVWQVSGRNDTSYRRRVAMDHLYARNNSLRLYLWVMLMTMPAVLSRRGSY